ncbi:hypothetical protein LCGC14_1904740 [marine sediment metagenome]|uniref:Uncharacterized protein n=1 Tax=marine sediment metagenome TaxID=412755 RepID=A0A0F9ITM5_9ZZZZ
MIIEDNKDEEIVEFFGMDNIIKDLYFELETKRAVMFGRQFYLWEKKFIIIGSHL